MLNGKSPVPRLKTTSGNCLSLLLLEEGIQIGANESDQKLKERDREGETNRQTERKAERKREKERNRDRDRERCLWETQNVSLFMEI